MDLTARHYHDVAFIRVKTTVDGCKNCGELPYYQHLKRYNVIIHGIRQFFCE